MSSPHADRVFIIIAYLVTPTPLHLLRDSTPYRVVRQQRERRERLVRRRTRPRFEEPLFDSYFFIRVPIRRDDGVSHAGQRPHRTTLPRAERLSDPRT